MSADRRRRSADAPLTGPQQELVEANLGLAWAAAAGWRNTRLDRDDLAQAGALGLVHAARTFVPSRGARFSTYATLLVRQAIARAVELERRERAATTAEGVTFDPPDHRDGRDVRAAERQWCVWYALSEMPRADRRLIEARVYGGASASRGRPGPAEARAIERLRRVLVAIDTPGARP